MAGRATIVILRSDADAGLGRSLKCILESISKGQLDRLHIHELPLAQRDSLPGVCQRIRPDLMILIEPMDAEASLFAMAHASVPKYPCLKCPLLAVLPASLAPEALAFLEAGASDFIVPPIRSLDVLPRILRLLRPRESEDELIAHLKRAIWPKQIVGQSPLLLEQLRKLPLIARCEATVLISGETGTGKELCARAVHYLGRRSGGPFVAVDCGAIPVDLIENELFGHERGAYTSAPTAQQGLVQESEGGTLFLDEIDALSVRMQSKLLRFLQEKEYRPLGSPKTRHADVRVIAASNISLEEAVHAGRFRQDLYYRLSVVRLQLPPLRDRREDIPLLARHFAQKYAEEFARPARDIAGEAVKRLLTYPWPGNARELENVIERAVLTSDGVRIEVCDLELPALETDLAGLPYQERKDRMVMNWERDELRKILSIYRGNVSVAARAEKKDAGALRALLRKHHLRASRESPHWRITV